MAEATPLAELLREVVEFTTSVVKCDSCFVYVLEGDGVGVAGFEESPSRSTGPLENEDWTGHYGLGRQASEPRGHLHRSLRDPRFRLFNELPEDRFEGFFQFLCSPVDDWSA